MNRLQPCLGGPYFVASLAHSPTMDRQNRQNLASLSHPFAVDSQSQTDSQQWLFSFNSFVPHIHVPIAPRLASQSNGWPGLVLLFSNRPRLQHSQFLRGIIWIFHFLSQRKNRNPPDVCWIIGEGRWSILTKRPYIRLNVSDLGTFKTNSRQPRSVSKWINYVSKWIPSVVPEMT